MKRNTNWDEIYVKNAPILLGVCRRYVCDVSLAEDIMHEGFIVAMQKEDTYKGKGSFEGWLYKIMANTSINYLRKSKKMQFVSDEGIEIMDNSQEVMSTISNISQKNRIITADFNQQELLEAIDNLPNHHKSVFNLYVVDNFSHNEIGQMLAISTGTSKSHLSRARKKIQEFLFEKTKEMDENKKSKRALLFILLFRRNYIDGMYKKSFANFTIHPVTPFDVNAVIHQFAIPSAVNVASNILTVVTTKVIIIATIVILSGIVYFSQQSESVIPKIKIENKIINTTNSLEVVKDTLVNSPKNNNDNSSNNKKESLQNQVIPAVKSEKNSVYNKTLAKDSIVQPIIIKRQIIERDTVYVHK